MSGVSGAKDNSGRLLLEHALLDAFAAERVVDTVLAGIASPSTHRRRQ